MNFFLKHLKFECIFLAILCHFIGKCYQLSGHLIIIIIILFIYLFISFFFLTFQNQSAVGNVIQSIKKENLKFSTHIRVFHMQECVHLLFIEIELISTDVHSFRREACFCSWYLNSLCKKVSSIYIKQFYHYATLLLNPGEGILLPQTW